MLLDTCMALTDAAYNIGFGTGIFAGAIVAAFAGFFLSLNNYHKQRKKTDYES